MPQVFCNFIIYNYNVYIQTYFIIIQHKLQQSACLTCTWQTVSEGKMYGLYSLYTQLCII